MLERSTIRLVVCWTMLWAGLSFASITVAQTRVVVIPMFDTKTVFTGVGKTGNSKCSENIANPGDAWEEVDCNTVPATLAGQDAELQAGADAVPRFIDNGDGSISDELTGLLWLADAFCAGAPVSWEVALGYIIELNTSGSMNGDDCGDTSNSSDWRLPNVKELQSLQYFGVDENGPFLSNSAGNSMAVEGDPFSGLRVDSAYWSSTSYGYVFDDDPGVQNNLIDNALRVNFKDAVTDGTSKDSLEHVWAVRNVN